MAANAREKERARKKERGERDKCILSAIGGYHKSQEHSDNRLEYRNHIMIIVGMKWRQTLQLKD